MSGCTVTSLQVRIDLNGDLVLEKKIAMDMAQNFPKNSPEKGVSGLGCLLDFRVLCH